MTLPRHRGRVAAERSDQYVENFRQRVVQDALAEAEGIYWIRRAGAFEAARPKAGDFRGKPTAADLRPRDVRLAAIAQACRRKAKVMMMADAEENEEIFFVTNEEIFFANISSERVLDV